MACYFRNVNIFDFSYNVTLYVYRKIPIPSRHRVKYKEMTSFYFFMFCCIHQILNEVISLEYLSLQLAINYLVSGM